MQLKMALEPVKPTATVSQAPPRRISAIEVYSASQPGEKSNMITIPVYTPTPPSPNMLQPRHARHAHLMASETKLQEWLRAQSVLAAATSPDHKPTTTDIEGTLSRPFSFLFPHSTLLLFDSQLCQWRLAARPSNNFHSLALANLKYRPCQLASHLHLHPSFILSSICPKLLH